MVDIISGKAIDSIFKKPKSLFVRVKAREILFDGLPIDCTVKDFAGSAVCSVLRSQEENFVVVEPNKYKVSMFGHVSPTFLVDISITVESESDNLI